MGAFAMPVLGKKGYGRKTESAGTKIVQLVEPMPDAVPHLLHAAVTVGATAHLLTVLRPLNKTTTSAAAAAAQAVINITANPGNYTGINTADNNIAAGDYCVYQTADGNWVVDTVSSVSTLAITMTTNVPTSGVSSGAPFFWFGVETDTNPNDNQAHPRYTLAASSLVQFGDQSGSVGFQSAINGPYLSGSLLHTDMLNAKGHPLILIIDNGTNASVLEGCTVVYTDRAQATGRRKDLTT